MAYQSIFQRRELKYMLTQPQKARVLEAIAPYLTLDQFGHSTIRNLYFDTNHYRLIRNSIEKPVYKEKLRIRSYSQADAHSTVFVELKKKYKGTVYKRRIALPEQEAMDWLCRKRAAPLNSQISAEIDYFLSYYGSLHPVVFLSYEREAYTSKLLPDLRITFDDTILCRQDDLSLRSPISGTSILPAGKVLMEIKCSGGMPLWLAHTLSEENIYKTSFSKYGTAYQTLIYPNLTEVGTYASFFF